MKDQFRFWFKLDIFHLDYNLDENRKIQISEKKNIQINPDRSDRSKHYSHFQPIETGSYTAEEYDSPF
jgi:hypothetical protein